MVSTVANRIQSVLSLCDINLSFRLELVDDFLESLAPMFVALELIEAGACRGQQNGIAWACVAISVRDGREQRFGIHQRYGAAQLLRDLPGSGADQHRGARLGSQGIAQHRVVQTLILPAQDHPQAAGEGAEARLYQVRFIAPNRVAL